MILALALLGAPALAADAFEAPPVLEAREIVGDVVLADEDYSVLEPVPTDGFMATFTIVSPYGDFTASGPGMLAVRLNEIRALAALDEVQSDAQFRQAAEQTARDTAGNLGKLVEHPEETLRGIPEGVGRLFNRTKRSIETGVQKIGDVREGRLPGVEGGTASNLPGGPAAATGDPAPGLAGLAARAGGDVVVNMLGYDKQRRRIAQELAVDPYTTNRVLAQKLDDVTWAAFAGGLGVNLVTSMIPGGTLIATSSQLTDWVYETPPGDLRVEIESTLRSAGVNDAEIDRFLRHHWYTLSMQAALAGSLQALDGVAGRADVISLALSVGSEAQARFVVQSVEMLKHYHLNRAPLAELVVAGTVFGRIQDGAVAVVAPVDYLSWTPILSGFASRPEVETEAGRRMHISGGVTDLARAELTALGWEVSDHSDLGPVEYPVR